MRMIKLTTKRGRSVWINMDTIVSMGEEYEGGTNLFPMGETNLEPIEVKESPERILKLADDDLRKSYVKKTKAVQTVANNPKQDTLKGM